MVVVRPQSRQAGTVVELGVVAGVVVAVAARKAAGNCTGSSDLARIGLASWSEMMRQDRF